MHTYGARRVTGIDANGANPITDENTPFRTRQSRPTNTSSVSKPSGNTSEMRHWSPSPSLAS
jgi:hypothetical protein